jgi:AraC-like DNA-binding protein
MRHPAPPAVGGGHAPCCRNVNALLQYHDMHQLLHAFAGSRDVDCADLRHCFLARTRMRRETRQCRLQMPAIEPPDAADRMIGAIAAKVGYENRVSFARAFRAAAVMVPAGSRSMKRMPGDGHGHGYT